MEIYDGVCRAVKVVDEAIAPREPEVGVILGSGLGGFADTLTGSKSICYGDIPGFARSKVKGHAGQLVAGKCGETEVLAMQGRVHLYEGHPISQVVLSARTLIMAGCKTLIITCAAGGINPCLEPGDLVLIRDHANPTGSNPLEGENDDRLGTRFPDMSKAYDPDLCNLAGKAAFAQQMVLRRGIYCFFPGPSYETPAEIQMAWRGGADLAGMSTVPEVIAARHMGARVLGIACVTNKAAGLQETLSHDEVKETAERVKETFISLLTKVVTALGEGK